MKTCSKCESKKELRMFHKDKSKLDGFHSHCNDCRSNASRIRNSGNECVLKRKQYYDYLKKHSPEKIQRRREYRIQYYQDHKEEEKARCIEYYNNNKELYKNRSTKRRTGTQLAKPCWYVDEKHQIEDIYRKRRELSDLTEIQHHVDHIIPIQHELVCGLHCLSNLRIISATENLKKGNKLININIIENLDRGT